jgi:hypothetical protein
MYQTPAGFSDDFFVYTFDAAGLTNGLNYGKIGTLVDLDSDFILRKTDAAITVLPSGAGTYRLRDADGSYRSSTGITPVTGHPDSMAIIPEIVYPGGSLIGLDLTNVLRAARAGGGETVIDSQFIFWGVKRTRKQPGVSGKYRYLPFSYELPFLLNWGNHRADLVTPEDPRPIYLQINNRDFILFGIRAFSHETPAGEGVPENVYTIDSLFRVMLYDAGGKQRMSGPVGIGYLNANLRGQAPGGVALTSVSYGNAVTPGIVYPVGSQVRMDITSMRLLTDTALPIRLCLFGVQRIPL